MKLRPIKNLNIQNGLRHVEKTSDVIQDKNPFFTSNSQDIIAFKGLDFQKTINKVSGNITYSNMDVVVGKIDNVLGDGYFSNLLRKTHLSINDKNELVLKDASIIKDIWNTITYPIKGLPFDLANWILKGFKKIPALTERIERLQGPDTILGKRLGRVELEKNMSLINDILGTFADPKIMGQKTENGVLFNSDKCQDLFRNTVAAGIKDPAKNYSSRDERTLNRIATSLVSAVYGSWDFYNISMLQKDDKKEAKKAKKARFKQEVYRMLFNAGTTFLMLGALDKYIRHSMPLSMLTIAGSAFLSEVVSRIFSKTPLRRLTPKEAEKIALQNNKNKAKASNVTNNNENKLNFKQRLHDDTDKIFVQFQSKDGTLPAIKYMKKAAAQPDNKKQKHKMTPLQIGGIAVAGAGILYMLSSYFKGDFKFRKDIKNLYLANKDRIDNYLKNPDSVLDSEIMEKINEIKDAHNSSSNKVDIFKKIRKLITKRTVNIKLSELNNELDKVKNTEEGGKIKEILEHYKKLIDENANSGDILKTKADRTLLKGVYNGISKLFGTIYIALSYPVRLIESGVNKIFYKDSSAALDIINKRNPEIKADEQLGTLYSIIKKSKQNYNAAAQTIAKNTRKFSTGPETSDLANNSRTLVTAISTYFFVNDYTNRVLIESAGKDTQRAKEERNERLAHKASNFVINGTLMNLFNSIFNKALNNSLPQATLIAGATEITNELLVRKSICQPILPRKTRQDIIDYESKQMTKKGIFGFWSRAYRKLTGKKSLTQKAGVSNKDKKVG